MAKFDVNTAAVRSYLERKGSYSQVFNRTPRSAVEKILDKKKEAQPFLLKAIEKIVEGLQADQTDCINLVDFITNEQFAAIRYGLPEVAYISSTPYDVESESNSGVQYPIALKTPRDHVKQHKKFHDKRYLKVIDASFECAIANAKGDAVTSILENERELFRSINPEILREGYSYLYNDPKVITDHAPYLEAVDKSLSTDSGSINRLSIEKTQSMTEIIERCKEAQGSDADTKDLSNESVNIFYATFPTLDKLTVRHTHKTRTEVVEKTLTLAHPIPTVRHALVVNSPDKQLALIRSFIERSRVLEVYSDDYTLAYDQIFTDVEGRQIGVSAVGDLFEACSDRVIETKREGN